MAITSTLTVVDDITAVASQLYLATDKTAVAGSLSIGKTTAPTARIDIKGAGATSATLGLLMQKSDGTQVLKINDAGDLDFGWNSGVPMLSMQGSTGRIYTDNYISKVDGGSQSMAFTSGQITFKVNNNNAVRFEYGKNTIGDAILVDSACLAVTSPGNNRGFLPPRMTTVQKNAIGTPASGLMVYDTTLGKLCVYTGAAWETITSV